MAQVAVYLAVAPKSNAVYRAYTDAVRDVRETTNEPVPLHIRNAPTRLMSELEYGKGYQYAHDNDDGFTPGQTYLPKNLDGHTYYHPTNRGFEKTVAERLAHWRKLVKEEKKDRSS